MTVYAGDNAGLRDNMEAFNADIPAQGVFDIDTPAGSFATETFIATAGSDGILDIRFNDTGGVSSYWMFNGIEIAGAATITLTGALNVDHDLTIIAGATLAGSNNSIDLAGDWNNARRHRGLHRRHEHGRSGRQRHTERPRLDDLLQFRNQHLHSTHSELRVGRNPDDRCRRIAYVHRDVRERAHPGAVDSVDRLAAERRRDRFTIGLLRFRVLLRCQCRRRDRSRGWNEHRRR